VSRLFVAVRPPEAVLDALESLPRAEERGVRYTTRDQWHVTLRFFGEVDERDASDALSRVAASTGVATLGPQVGRLGRDVVVVPVGGLDDLARAVVRATADVGDPPDPRPFSGHLTVARLKHRGACRVAGAPIAATFQVSEVELVRSELHPEGARYETVAVRTLSANPDR
jgi:2'-5' RNA ligase